MPAIWDGPDSRARPKKNQGCCSRFGSIGLPELKVARPGRLPVVVKVEEDVDPPIETTDDPIEVGMDLQRALAADLMNAAAVVGIVDEQRANPRESESWATSWPP